MLFHRHTDPLDLIVVSDGLYFITFSKYRNAIGFAYISEFVLNAFSEILRVYFRVWMVTCPMILRTILLILLHCAVDCTVS